MKIQIDSDSTLTGDTESASLHMPIKDWQWLVAVLKRSVPTDSFPKELEQALNKLKKG